ncbi:MAG: metal-sensitive transcriptional regulator [Candidatus Omnitrophica bacterium]|nr:metal-sensitive transcriptional regulator [Candidatus Omnitrophota bacterium]
MKENPSHKSTLDALKRIEGQVRGIQKMVEGKRYCIDILTQLSAVGSAVARVQDKILERHLDTCVTKAFMGESKTDKKKKIDEVIKLLKTFRKSTQ